MTVSSNLLLLTFDCPQLRPTYWTIYEFTSDFSIIFQSIETFLMKIMTTLSCV